MTSLIMPVSNIFLFHLLASRGKDAEFKFEAQLVANLRDSFMQVEGYSRGLSGFSCFSYKSTRTEIEREKK